MKQISNILSNRVWHIVYGHTPTAGDVGVKVGTPQNIIYAKSLIQTQVELCNETEISFIFLFQ